ncbi:peptidoglycan-binding protein [Rhodobacteraceae bacterium WD3A24]|nr:peptidoglycan-binding protein [Rhodobacteraceae bacterium WD3A24]
MPQPERPLDAETVRRHEDGPPGAAPGTCWGRDVTPARVETVTEQRRITPTGRAPDGTVTRPAVYTTETRQRITRPRREVWFRAPCPEVMNAGFVESLQRALRARGAYDGPVTGRMTPATRQAVRAFQRSRGLDSSVLSLDAARQLGLVAYDRDDL